MKANEAPEKIYVHRTFHLGLLAASQINITGSDVEYTRTDAFIEKACEGIEHLLSGYIIRNFHFGDSYEMDTLIEDFKTYMKGDLNMLTEQYCSFEVAKLLKEKGFDEPCFYYYKDKVLIFSHSLKGRNSYQTDTCSAPTLQMAMKWLREEKRISIIIEFDLTKRGYCPYVYQLDYDMDWIVKWRINIPMKYEEAIAAALKYSLENLI